MPLFSNKFTPKKAPLRKSLITDVGRDADSIADKVLLQDGNVKLCVGDHEMIFEDGNWVAGSASGENTAKANQKLRKQMQHLKEENNLLRLKFDILLDMLTETTAESHSQQREMEKLKRSIK